MLPAQAAPALGGQEAIGQGEVEDGVGEEEAEGVEVEAEEEEICVTCLLPFLPPVAGGRGGLRGL